MSKLDPDKAAYRVFPKLEPYTRFDRYENPKEVFKAVAKALGDRLDPSEPRTLGDVACGNGEMLYYFKGLFPEWKLTGFDYTQEFIDTAKAYDGLDGVDFNCGDLFDIDRTFDAVTCCGLMTTFWEPEQLLEKLLAICNEGGLVVVDGCFNAHDVELRTMYMDRSRKETDGIWRRDWSQHTQKGLREWLDGRCRSVDFEEVVMGVDIPKDPAKPDIFVWTFKDAEGRNIITNGTNVMLNAHLMVIAK